MGGLRRAGINCLTQNKCGRSTIGPEIHLHKEPIGFNAKDFGLGSDWTRIDWTGIKLGQGGASV